MEASIEIDSETATLLSLPAPTPILTTQQSSFSAPSEVAPGNLSDYGSLLEDVTFYSWRVIRELFERTMLLVKLEKVNALCFPYLRKHSVTSMHQVFSWLVPVFLFSLLFLMPSFVIADAFHECFDELVIGES